MPKPPVQLTVADVKVAVQLCEELTANLTGHPATVPLTLFTELVGAGVPELQASVLAEELAMAISDCQTETMNEVLTQDAVAEAVGHLAMACIEELESRKRPDPF